MNIKQNRMKYVEADCKNNISKGTWDFSVFLRGILFLFKLKALKIVKMRNTLGPDRAEPSDVWTIKITSFFKR